MSSKFQVEIDPKHCKACGICIAVCPKQVLAAERDGKAVVDNMDHCIGCRLCEFQCPDFAITVTGGKIRD